jgi:hypothetical protein
VIDKLFRRANSGALQLTATKPVVLVLGTGWGAHSLVKVCCAREAAAWQGVQIESWLRSQQQRLRREAYTNAYLLLSAVCLNTGHRH